jgi:hypothetical protein
MMKIPMNDPINPLSDLSTYKAPKDHTSGRRELRNERNAMGFTIHARPKSQDEALKAAATGQMVETLPIRQVQPKVSKKERRRMRRDQKDSSKINPVGV